MELYFMVFCILTKLVVSQKPSPCPNTFSYEPKGTENDRWYGVISLTTSEELSGVWLRIKLDRQADLIGNWFGDTSSEDNIEYRIRNRQYKLEVGPPVSVRFFVKYNPAKTIPSVEKITLNGRTICSTLQKESELGPVKPALHISQSTATQNSSSNSAGRRQDNMNQGKTGFNSEEGDQLIRPVSGDSQFFLGDFAKLVVADQTKPPSSKDQVGSRSLSCGTVAARATPLISKGQDTWPGQWPWHVAIYISMGIQLQYICGGTLITEQHIVTAAHCVTQPRTNRVVNPDNFLIYLGKYKLTLFGSDVQDRSISEIFIHPEYNHSVYFNDIAVLKLSRPVTITNFVRPCCLWEGDSNLEGILRQEGTVVGWGFDENRKLSDKLMQAKMPIVSTVDCIFSNRDFFSQFVFEKNYCAGFRNGTSVCNGDSGGGMVFPKRGTSGQNTVWQLRGMVSVGVALQGEGTCDTSQYIVFTDAAKYTHWIRQVISN